MDEWNTMFSAFGPHGGIVKLLCDTAPSGPLYGAVIDGMRGSPFFGAAVWDGTRIHSLEGFLSAAEAEQAATDVICLIAELQCGDRHAPMRPAVAGGGGDGRPPLDASPLTMQLQAHAADLDFQVGPLSSHSFPAGCAQAHTRWRRLCCSRAPVLCVPKSL